MPRRVRYEVGDVVEVADSWGYGPTYLARVEERSRDIKNGRPGGAGEIISHPRGESGGKWWYSSQVRRVVSRRHRDRGRRRRE